MTVLDVLKEERMKRYFMIGLAEGLCIVADTYQNRDLDRGYSLRQMIPPGKGSMSEAAEEVQESIEPTMNPRQTARVGHVIGKPAHRGTLPRAGSTEDNRPRVFCRELAQHVCHFHT